MRVLQQSNITVL